MHRGWLPAALILLVATALAPGAAAHDGDGEVPPVAHPVCDLETIVESPLEPILCETEASVQANATVPGYGGPCIQTDPGPPYCEDHEVGLQAHVGADGHLFYCWDVDDHGHCGPDVDEPLPADPVELP